MKLNLSGSYSMSEASLSDVNMPVDNPEFQAATAALAEDNYDYSHMKNYSDMSFDYFNINASMKYKIYESVAFKLGLEYHNISDNKTYVYGDESGSFYVIRTGFQFGNSIW